MPDREMFVKWMRKVDTHLERMCGLGHDDLADQPFYEWFEDGTTPKEAARMTLDDNRG